MSHRALAQPFLGYQHLDPNQWFIGMKFWLKIELSWCTTEDGRRPNRSNWEGPISVLHAYLQYDFLQVKHFGFLLIHVVSF